MVVNEIFNNEYFCFFFPPFLLSAQTYHATFPINQSQAKPKPICFPAKSTSPTRLVQISDWLSSLPALALIGSQNHFATQGSLKIRSCTHLWGRKHCSPRVLLYHSCTCSFSRIFQMWCALSWPIRTSHHLGPQTRGNASSPKPKRISWLRPSVSCNFLWEDGFCHPKVRWLV